jgi:hypothetical protein
MPRSARHRAPGRHGVERVALIGVVGGLIAVAFAAVPGGWVPAAPSVGARVGSTTTASPVVNTDLVTSPQAQRVRRGSVLTLQRRAVVPWTGSGSFLIAPVMRADPRASDLSYSVEVEADVPFNAKRVARQVDLTLGDPRSWGAALGISMRRVVSRPDLRILLATPGTTDRLCAPLDTAGRVSCRNGPLVVLNASRWAFAVPWFDADVMAYRRYVVNHEVGHALGRAHERCPGRGRPAPVMQQQSYGLQGCLPSGWPSPGELD